MLTLPFITPTHSKQSATAKKTMNKKGQLGLYLTLDDWVVLRLTVGIYLHDNPDLEVTARNCLTRLEKSLSELIYPPQQEYNSKAKEEK